MSGRHARPGPVEPGDVPFPVTPMLDMAFQLLAFFILTFQPPSAETRIDLDLPAAPVALPKTNQNGGLGVEATDDLGLETDLEVRAEANDRGDLIALRLGPTAIADPDQLGDRVRSYVEALGDRPVRVRLLADDRLRYEVTARLLGQLDLAGVSAIRLSASTPAPPP